METGLTGKAKRVSIYVNEGDKHGVHAINVAIMAFLRKATVEGNALIRDAIAAMLGGEHKIVAVVDAEKCLVGVIDRADLLHGLVSLSGTEE